MHAACRDHRQRDDGGEHQQEGSLPREFRGSLPDDRLQREHARCQHQQHREHPHHEVSAGQGPRQQRLVDVDEAPHDPVVFLAPQPAANEQRDEGRDNRHRDDGHADQREALGERQRMKQFALTPAEHEHRHERQQHDEHGEKDRPPHRAAGRDDQFARVARDRVVAEAFLEDVRGVLDHHDGLIDEDADRNRDPGQRHDVRLNVDDPQRAQHPHHQERKQHRQRQREADHEHAADVRQDQQDGNGRNDHLVPHDLGQRVNRAVDQPRPVVGGDDMDAFGETGLQLLNLLLDEFRDGERVLAVPHQHDAPHNFAAIFLVDAAAELRPELHGRDGLDKDGRAVHFADHGAFDVAFVAQPADAAHDVFGVVLLDHAATGGHVAASHRRIQVAQRDAERAERLGTDINLVFDRHPADRGHVRDAARRVELRRDVELVDRPQPLRIDRPRRIGLDGVPEDLSEGGRVGSQIRHDARRQIRPRLAEFLGHALPGEIEVHAIVEDDRDHREVELGRRPHRAHTGQPAQLVDQRIGQLILDLARTATHPVGEDDHLVLAEIGNRIDRRVVEREDARHGQQRRRDEHQKPVADGRLDNVFDHGVGSARGASTGVCAGAACRLSASTF